MEISIRNNGASMKSVDEILKIIIDCIRSVLPDLDGHDFSHTDRLADLGANSVDRAEIVIMVLEQLGLRIPRTETHGPKNIGELAELLQTKLSE